MKCRTKILTALLLLVAVALVITLVLERAAPRVSGPLNHEVYVWQRAWTESVRDAVGQHVTNFASLVALKAEVSWKDKQPQVTRVAVDYAMLAKAPCPVGLALRIGPYPGPFSGNDEAAHFLGDLSVSLIAEARTNGVKPSELQIDFDCAASKLDGYRAWVDAIRGRVAPVPVTITALPSWLKSSAFKPLAVRAPNYVLQVHSLERPKDFAAPFTLCDPVAAQRAVERAGRIGVPFRVALPTYGYVIAFDRAGRFIGLSAEGPGKDWPAGVQLREVRTDPAAMARLVQTWTASQPEALRGIIWYRLPVSQDVLNLRWPTLAAMMAARSPRESLRAETRRVEAGLVEVSLVNDGELDVSSRLAVEVHWQDARLVAGDGLRNFELAEQSASAARFQTKSVSSRLPAGEKLTVGWLRFSRDCEVQVEVKKM